MLEGLLAKVIFYILKALYPIILKFILKPMSPEEQEKWNEVTRKGGTKEDVMDFHRNRGKVVNSNVIIKENKPKPKTSVHNREK